MALGRLIRLCGAAALLSASLLAGSGSAQGMNGIGRATRRMNSSMNLYVMPQSTGARSSSSSRTVGSGIERSR